MYKKLLACLVLVSVGCDVMGMGPSVAYYRPSAPTSGAQKGYDSYVVAQKYVTQLVPIFQHDDVAKLQQFIKDYPKLDWTLGYFNLPFNLEQVTPFISAVTANAVNCTAYLLAYQPGNFAQSLLTMTSHKKNVWDMLRNPPVPAKYMKNPQVQIGEMILLLQDYIQDRTTLVSPAPILQKTYAYQIAVLLPQLMGIIAKDDLAGLKAFVTKNPTFNMDKFYLNLQAPNAIGIAASLLMMAAWYGAINTVQYLISQHPWSPAAVDRAGSTAVVYLAASPYVDKNSPAYTNLMNALEPTAA